jgi:hypothetical protein
MKRNRYVICPSCDAMNPSFGEICDQCGAPISNNITGESRQQSEPEPGRTHFQSPTILRLIGVWMLSLPNIFAGLYVAFVYFRHWPGLSGFIMFWGDIGLTCLWFIIFYRTTKNYFFPRPQPELSQE